MPGEVALLRMCEGGKCMLDESVKNPGTASSWSYVMKAISPAMEKRNHFIRMPPGREVVLRSGSDPVAAEVAVIVPASSKK